ncbi:MAG: TrbI/VirB10 family protein [Acidobacteriota bacterium]
MVKRAVLLLSLVILAGWPALAATYTVPAGTVLNCRLSQTLSTSLNFRGQPFTATLAEPVVVNGNRIIPAGATVRGRIASLSKPGHIKGVGKMLLVPETLALPNGRTFTLNGVLLHAYGAPGAKVANPEGVVKGPNARMRDLKEVGIGVGGGGVLGTAIGGLHGTLVGGLIGGAAGLLDSFRRRGPDLTLPRGTELKFQLNRQLVVSRSGVAEYDLSSR